MPNKFRVECLEFRTVRKLKVLHILLSTLNSQPSTLNPQLSTLNSMKDRAYYLAYQRAYYHSHKPAKKKYVRKKDPTTIVCKPHISPETALRNAIPEKVAALQQRINDLQDQLAHATGIQADELQRQINILHVKILQTRNPVCLQGIDKNKPRD